MAAILDGLQDTILVVEAGPNVAVPWTRPEDLMFDPNDPTAALGNVPAVGFPVAMFDGSTKVISAEINAKTLRAVITSSGGDLFRWSDVTNP